MNEKWSKFLILFLFICLVAFAFSCFYSKKNYVDTYSLDLGLKYSIEKFDYEMFSTLIDFSDTRMSEQERKETYKKSLLYSFEDIYECSGCPENQGEVDRVS